MIAQITLINASVEGMIARGFNRIVDITAGIVKGQIEQLGPWPELRLCQSAHRLQPTRATVVGLGFA